MRISQLFEQAGPVFSFEFSPPRTAEGERSLLRTVERLRDLEPAFVSVTYGAGGSTREKTLEITTRVKKEFGLEAMAHLTCVGHDRAEILAILDRLQESGIENVLPLRGDPPRGESAFVRPENGFGYATELVRFIRELGHPFCLGGACYPEGHQECPDLAEDLQHLIEKVRAGLDFVITQLFFDNADYFAFNRRAVDAGIDLPIIPGIMPITNLAQIVRITQMCGAHIPESLQRRLEKAPDQSAVEAVGIDHATQQCRELLAAGAPGIHFYTLNKSTATTAILAELRD